VTEHPDEKPSTPLEQPTDESTEGQPAEVSGPTESLGAQPTGSASMGAASGSERDDSSPEPVTDEEAPAPPAPEPDLPADAQPPPPDSGPQEASDPESLPPLQGLEPAWPTAQAAPEPSPATTPAPDQAPTPQTPDDAADIPQVPAAPTSSRPDADTSTPSPPLGPVTPETPPTVASAAEPTPTEPQGSEAAPAGVAPAREAVPHPAPTPALIPPHPVPRPAASDQAAPAALGDSGAAPVLGAGLATPPSGPPAESFGRVDADGTVWVRTAGGDVHVGQFQAGSPDEALTYFARKYATLETEVSLLEQRLASGADVGIEEAAATIARIDASLETPQVVGDVDGLRVRVAGLTPALQARKAAARAEKAKAREEAKAAREAIVVQAEALADSTSWKSSGDRLRSLLDEWKAAPRVDRATEQAMWKRFSAARNSFDRRRRAHFAKLTSEQGEAKATKTALVKEAEALSASTDWAATAAEYRRLMDRWKQAGRAARSDDDALWARFRSAQDIFFTARSAAFSERDAGQAENLKAKTALAAEAEALLPLGDLGTAKTTLRDIHERWEKVGHVPRADKERVEGRLRRVEQAVREAEEGRWRRSNPEARARAEASIEQLTTTIAKLDKELARADAAGDERAAAEAREALEARHSWLTEAEKALAEFSGD
jgi:Domain of Unknown Function (DUF349)